MHKPRVLVVDDDKSICNLLKSVLELEEYSHRIAFSGEEARRFIASDHFDILISDIYLGDASGLDLLMSMKAVNPDSEVVIMTAHGSVETAVHAVHHGAFDYISKPFAVDEVLGIIKRIEEKFQVIETIRTADDAAPAMRGDKEIIGTSPRMVEIYKKLARIASIDSAVLILGETGSGKELIARAIHANSSRAGRKLVVVNCGSLTETLLEAELFGHEKGAFTGANAARKGLLEDAAGGTLFLDEISETSLNFQVKLLRVIQEHEIRRVGGNETVTIDIRVIAATNRDLREMVRTNQFREDLFHRLNVFTISVPPLRERVTDIPLLANYYLGLFNAQFRKSARLAPDAIEAMKRYHWPGNVRELKNLLERTVTFNDTGLIQVSELEFGESSTEEPIAVTPPSGSPHSLDEMEREHIIRVLRETGGNKKKAAEILGIERRTLYNKAKRLGIDFSNV